MCTSRIDEDAKQGFLPCCLYQSFDTCHLDALIVASLVKIDIRYILFFFCIINCNEVIWSCFHTTYSCLGGNIHENVGDLVLHIKINLNIGNNKNVTLNDWLEENDDLSLRLFQYYNPCKNISYDFSPYKIMIFNEFKPRYTLIVNYFNVVA